MIEVLQAGRFIAAVAVVSSHAVVSTTAFVDQPPHLIQSILNYGYLGVDFFFVLFGFIIHYTMSARDRSGMRFAQDRLVRVMLPYLPVGILLAVAYTALPNLSAADREWSWVSTLTLLPTAHAPALSVAWTLQHELFFYLIYALLVNSSRIQMGLAIWTGAIVASDFLSIANQPLLRVVLAPINLDFIAGVAAAEFFLSSRAVSAVCSSALAVSFLGLFILAGADRGESLLVGFAIAALLPWICRLERDGSFLVPRWLTFGGFTSYSLYLVHNPLLSILSRLFAQIDLGWGLALPASIAICASGGTFWYLAYERPVMRLVKDRSRFKVGS